MDDSAWGDHPLSAAALLELCRGVLNRGALFRFRATGGSMSPLIQDGDVVTLKPVAGEATRVGDVVAFIHPGNKGLAIHRVLRRRSRSRLLQGDAAQEPDGWVDTKDIFGRVVAVQRKGRPVRLGLGAERVCVAWLRRYNAAWNVARAMRRTVRTCREIALVKWRRH